MAAGSREIVGARSLKTPLNGNPCAKAQPRLPSGTNGFHPRIWTYLKTGLISSASGSFQPARVLTPRAQPKYPRVFCKFIVKLTSIPLRLIKSER